MTEDLIDVGGGVVVPLVRSAIIPARFHHGFSTRRGGVSAAPFDSLNLGGKWGDARASVVENRRRLQAAAGVDRIFLAAQVHGAAAVRVRAGDALADVAVVQADALYSDGVTLAAPGAGTFALGVYVADCIPALIADARTGAFAAVHAGWRGTVAGVLPVAARRLIDELGARPADLRVALGPAIGVCCFEVGDEVVAAVERVLPGAAAAGAIRTGPRGRAHVDLKRVNLTLLEREGVPPSAVDAGPECTSCARERFFSYRRDKGQTGQAIGFIAVTDAAR
jgi:purine-nucleoside/S-methyl-5'-thioadenosine phosphorylase / adenosine deaminase